jgi:hypothetical protein
LVPADALAVIGAPDPGVVDERAVGVDAQVHVGLAHVGASDAEEYVVERDGIAAVTDV